MMGCSLDPAVDAALRERVRREGAKLSHVVEDILRAALGLPPVPDAVAFEPAASGA